MLVAAVVQHREPDIAVWFMLLFAFEGLLIAGLCRPLAQRRVKPNSLGGFRTSRTLRDERVWYDTNAFFGQLGVKLGILYAVASVVLYFTLGAWFIVYNLACASVLIGGLAVIIRRTFRYLRSIDDPTPPSS